MATLTTASLVLLAIVGLVYLLAFLIQKRKFFTWMGLSWFLNLVYLGFESNWLGSQPAGVYFSSMASSFFLMLALFDLYHPSRGFRVVAVVVFLVTYVLSYTVPSSVAMQASGSNDLIWYLPGAILTMVVLLSLASWFYFNGPDEALELLRPIGLIDDVQEKNAHPIFSSIQVARFCLMWSFGIYGLMQPLYIGKEWGMPDSVFQALFWVAFAMKLLNGIGAQGLVLALIRDTNRRLINQSLSEEIGVLTASIEHDIRNPLGLARTTLGLLRRKLQASKDILRHLDKLEEHLRRIAVAVDIVPLMRENRETYLNQVKFADVLKILENAVKACKIEFSGRRINVQYKSSRNEVMVLAYRERLLQSFVNLIRNSIEATIQLPGFGLDDSINLEVDVMLNREKHNAIVVVRDFGVGLDSDDQNLIFRPFYSTKKTVKSSNRGIGLFIADRIIQQHGGQLALTTRKEKGRNVTEARVVLELRK